MSVKAVVSIFCGGRGSTTIIRELLQHPDIKLNLLVNAYDDGLSTGELRQFIPGLLGASDFRKNIVNLLDFSSSNQSALKKFLEYRFPSDFEASELNGFLCYIKDSSNYHFLSDELQSLFKNLESNLRLKLLEYLRFFLDYYSKQKKIFNFRDCSLGNILFAGAYLKNNQCFNDVIAELSTLFALQNKLINVTQGENRILVGLKENGEILDCEAKIVGKQSPAKIVDLFLLENHLTNDQREKISVLSLEKKWLYLKQLDTPVSLSQPAREALLNSQIIIFGPGTQFSSLFPSYKTAEIAAAIRNSRARLKAFIVNLNYDCDIQFFTVTDLVDKALYFLEDEKNDSHLITHIFHNIGNKHYPNRIKLHPQNLSPDNYYKNAKVIQGEFADSFSHEFHSGRAIVESIFKYYDMEG